MKFLLHFLITAGIIYALAQSGSIPWIEIQGGYSSALIFAVILSLVNLLLGTLLRIITFPLRLLTLWLFSLVVTAIVVKVADEMVPTVTLVGLIPIIAVAIIMSVTAFIFKMID
jgi:putative membrane protein